MLSFCLKPSPEVLNKKKSYYFYYFLFVFVNICAHTAAAAGHGRGRTISRLSKLFFPVVELLIS